MAADGGWRDYTVAIPSTYDGDTVGASVEPERDCGAARHCLALHSQRVGATPTPEPTPSNNSASGAPTISGTAQVGETLTANTSAIADADGLSGVSFAYRWLADTAAIANATGSTYELTVSELGNTITVQVTFTDDLGNDESQTSAATATVIAADVTPPAPDFNWRFDTLAAFETYFTVETGASNGDWRFDSDGSTASSQTGPGTNNADPFVHTEVSSNSGETALEMNGLAVVLDDASNAVLHDRDIVIRYCMQGVFDLDPLQSLRFQGRNRRGRVDEHRQPLHGWTYSSQYDAGDSVTDSNGDTFTVAQDWRLEGRFDQHRRL